MSFTSERENEEKQNQPSDCHKYYLKVEMFEFEHFSISLFIALCAFTLNVTSHGFANYSYLYS